MSYIPPTTLAFAFSGVYTPPLVLNAEFRTDHVAQSIAAGGIPAPTTRSTQEEESFHTGNISLAYYPFSQIGGANKFFSGGFLAPYAYSFFRTESIQLGRIPEAGAKTWVVCREDSLAGGIIPTPYGHQFFEQDFAFSSGGIPLAYYPFPQSGAAAVISAGVIWRPYAVLGMGTARDSYCSTKPIRKGEVEAPTYAGKLAVPVGAFTSGGFALGKSVVSLKAHSCTDGAINAAHLRQGCRAVSYRCSWFGTVVANRAQPARSFTSGGTPMSAARKRRAYFSDVFTGGGLFPAKARLVQRAYPLHSSEFGVGLLERGERC